jgi:hypothetical protein
MECVASETEFPKSTKYTRLQIYDCEFIPCRDEQGMPISTSDIEN